LYLRNSYVFCVSGLLKIIMKIFFLCALLLSSSVALAGTVSGTISLPSSGQGLANGTLTFSLTQAAVLSGTATLPTNPVSCYTDAGGNVVGLPNPLAAPAPSQNLGAGTLAAASYFYRITYFNASGESAASPENAFTLGGTGTLIIAAPPAKTGATGYNVYISTTSGTETRQGAVTGFASNYSQSSALSAGAALPASNSSVCSVFFNDQLTPSYTGYNVNLLNSAGAQVGGFPQKWYLSGGANGTVNVAQGTPLYSGIVVYPQAVVGTPIANAQQSINGPLTLNGFPVTAGSYISSSANPAGTGVLRGSATDLIACMRNSANTADACFADAGAAAPATGNLADLLLLSGFSGYQGSAYVDRSATPAQSGVERTGNNVCAVASRNAAGTGDVCAVQIDGSNVANIGGSAGMKVSGPINTSSQAIQNAASVQWGTETVSASPRMFLSGYIPGNPNFSGSSYQRFTFDKAITVTRIEILSDTGVAGCTTSAVVSLVDVTAGNVALTSLVLTNGTGNWDSGTIAVNISPAHVINLATTTGSVGCSTFAQNIHISIQYRMQ
jgi:hypothetical protein